MTDEHDCECGIDDGRRRFVQGCGAAMAFAAAGTSLGTVAGDASGDVSALLADLPDNWGRWGDDDELGALNLLGSEEMFEGMRAASKRGAKGVERFTLQLSMTGEVINPDPDQPEVVFPNDDAGWPSTDVGDPAFPPRTPARRDNTTPEGGSPVAGGVSFVDDKFVTDAFLQGTTHLDALGHAWYGDEIYNGFPADSTETGKSFETPLLGSEGRDALPDDGDPEDLTLVEETQGLAHAAVSNPADAGIFGRAVLLDVGRHLDVADEHDRLPLGYGVTYDDLQATADAQDTEIRDRDLLLVRTGAVERTRDPNAEWAPLNEPGLAFSDALVEWVAEMDIPYIGADNLAVEKVVQTVDGDSYVIPLHGAFLRNLGVYLNEILRLDDLAAACAADGIYEFLLAGAPLNVERASGGAINPVAVKATGGGRR
ncbi:cyclase family protein [Halorarius halobius]|uniref:cyclase family protein n=1 Tax=Halorarius halobius TaxID=2962671 RepID=UPI0020CEE3F5|nr:cyclase family protein [Halorarius halobius]